MSSAPNMATITASLERSLRNCSINNHHQSHGTTSSFAIDNDSDSVEDHRDYNIYSSSDNSAINYYSHRDDAALDLNSQISLPYQWEQCLDLKSGEIYYINWSTGMKAREDPRTSHREMIVDHHYDNYYTEEDEEDEEDDDDEEEEDDNSSSSSSSTSEVYSPPEVEAASASSSSSLLSRNEEGNSKDERSRQVLVVAGCKVCLMYFMVPKQAQLCPKCTSAHLLHF